ncbi:hypothetical protein J3Q64DRAFT_1720282 [Phycomyces blakesleeanus]|uniref:Uncharacterized protein n=2 Tax=Phycomyces blakesleeanus TaxID=4837 RepID=A0A167JYM1_PHYB8|nr:hypothetical protein PHYBLDRAFT_174639 [Phycomyces blakesleeanus NRRL 1555(-)]OAD66926.1 hypothetical protein PHYBLDRAFT_174639 [Phycomyces blakesleeanus NRRL 1555(-)]|eukprot:XP_018284966.1 hypothetical protein PHYBLDRAFT_174639 [Phycomyces blakesleeanus NRRL 1555(-)]
MDSYIDRVKNRVINNNSGAPPFVLANDKNTYRPSSLFSASSAPTIRLQSSSATLIQPSQQSSIPPTRYGAGYNRPPSILHPHRQTGSGAPTHLLGPILGAFAGLIVLAGFVLCLVRRRRPFSRTQKVFHTFQETNESKTRQGWGTTMTHSWSTLGSSSSAFSACPPPPVYTPKDTRRLTNTTLTSMTATDTTLNTATPDAQLSSQQYQPPLTVGAVKSQSQIQTQTKTKTKSITGTNTLVDLTPFRQNSLSSKNQYTPQLAFSPSAMGDRFSSESLLHVAPAWSSFMISARSTEHPVNNPNKTFQRK